MKKVVITYGTFDLFHVGHLNLLKRLKEGADFLIVGVSTDEFNNQKGKKTVIPFSERIEIVRNLRCVDHAIAEDCWEQKISDIEKYEVSMFAIGEDWKHKFDFLKDYCEVKYLARTPHISTSELKASLKILDRENIEILKSALDRIHTIVDCLE